MLKKLYHIALRECGIMRKNPIYLFCMVIFPIVVILFFTSLMTEGVSTDMPVGVVDQGPDCHITPAHPQTRCLPDHQGCFSLRKHSRSPQGYPAQ